MVTAEVAKDSLFPSLSARECAEFILTVEKAAVVPHRSPDADAVGSCMALVYIIRALGGEAVLLSPEKVPERLGFLTENEEILSEYDGGYTLISADVASPEQLGAFSALSGRFALSVDHHGVGESFAPNYTVPDAAACGELVFDIAEELIDMGKSLDDRRIWNAIFAAISGDTGSFKIGNTTANSFMCAAELKLLGADTEWVSRELHSVFTRSQIEAEKLALSKMKYFLDGKIAAAAISYGEITSNCLKNDDFSHISDKLRGISGVLVGVSMREIEAGAWRVSMRANVAVDCASVAKHFGGGGHLKAAGCSVLAKTADEAVEILIPVLTRAVEEYERTEA